MERLPNELLFQIASNLDAPSVLNLAATSKWAYVLFNSQNVWKVLCENVGWATRAGEEEHDDESDEHPSWIFNRRRQIDDLIMDGLMSTLVRQTSLQTNSNPSGHGLPELSEGEPSGPAPKSPLAVVEKSVNWKRLFRKMWTSEHDFTRGKCSIDAMNGQTGSYGWMQFCEGNTIKGTGDGKIVVWDTVTGNQKFMLSGHTDKLSCLQVHDNRIISASFDHTIRAWDLNGNPLHVFQCEGYIPALRFNHRYIVAADDATLRLWDLQTGKPHLVVDPAHDGPIITLQFDHHRVVTSSLDLSVRVFDVTTGVTRFILQGHEKPVAALHFNSHMVCGGSIDQNVYLWDIGGQDKKDVDQREAQTPRPKVLKGHTGWVNSVQIAWRKVVPEDSQEYFPSIVIVTGSVDRTVRVWDAVGCSCLFVLDQMSPVICVEVRDIATSASARPLAVEHSNDDEAKRDVSVQDSVRAEHIISLGLDGKIVYWDMKTGETVRSELSIVSAFLAITSFSMYHAAAVS